MRMILNCNFAPPSCSHKGYNLSILFCSYLGGGPRQLPDGAVIYVRCCAGFGQAWDTLQLEQDLDN